MIDSFFFDFDGTLSPLEGIDVLAAMNGVAKKVQKITTRCMGKTGLTLNDYRNRLTYVQPTKSQIQQLATLYASSITPGATEIIKILLRLKKKVYIISSGIKEAIIPFAKQVAIPLENVLAVEVYFDLHGQYQGFNEQSPLVKRNGKKIAIEALHKTHQRSLLVGDGVSDWEAQTAVTRFVGYAGLHPKSLVKEHSAFYITNTSLYSLLPLGLTNEEKERLGAKEKFYYEQGLADIRNKIVLIRGE